MLSSFLSNTSIPFRQKHHQQKQINTPFPPKNAQTNMKKKISTQKEKLHAAFMTIFFLLISHVCKMCCTQKFSWILDAEIHLHNKPWEINCYLFYLHFSLEFLPFNIIPLSAYYSELFCFLQQIILISSYYKRKKRVRKKIASNSKQSKMWLINTFPSLCASIRIF